MTMLLYLAGGTTVLLAVLLLLAFRSGHLVVVDASPTVDVERPRYEFDDRVYHTIPDPDGSWNFVLPLSGREIFTPFKLLRDRVYRVTISGRYWHSTAGRLQQADGFYLAATAGNLTKRSCRLYVDGEKLADLDEHRFTEERAHHRYSFLIDGTGNHLSLSFAGGHDASYGPEPLKATVSLEPETVPRVADEALVRQRQEADEERERKLATLTVMSEGLRNWGDPDFRSSFAARFPRELLSKREEIVNGYFSMHEDPILLNRLKTEHPAVWDRLSGRFEALLEAERVNAKPKRMTPEQFRERLKARANVAAADQYALMEGAIEAYEKKRTLLLESGIDEDTAEAVLGPMSDAIDESLAQHEDHKKGGNNASNAIAVG